MKTCENCKFAFNSAERPWTVWYDYKCSKEENSYDSSSGQKKIPVCRSVNDFYSSGRGTFDNYLSFGCKHFEPREQKGMENIPRKTEEQVKAEWKEIKTRKELSERISEIAKEALSASPIEYILTEHVFRAAESYVGSKEPASNVNNALKEWKKSIEECENIL